MIPDTPHQAFDQHLNMILGEVEETLTTVEIDDETYEEIIKVTAERGLPCLPRCCSSCQEVNASF